MFLWSVLIVFVFLAILTLFTHYLVKGEKNKKRAEEYRKFYAKTLFITIVIEVLISIVCFLGWIFG